MIYCFDIDGTICTPGTCRECQYEGATPKKDRIEVVNKLYEEGNYIIYMTARAMGRHKDLPHEEAKQKASDIILPLTKMQLDIWGCKYHELIMGKPHADMFIDDKGWSDVGFFNIKKETFQIFIKRICQFSFIRFVVFFVFFIFRK